MTVIRVLIVASPAPLKIRASRIDSLWRSLNECLDSSARESRLLLAEHGLDLLSLKNIGNKDSFARPAFVRWQPCQSISAINQFFDFELHVFGF